MSNSIDPEEWERACKSLSQTMKAFKASFDSDALRMVPLYVSQIKLQGFESLSKAFASSLAPQTQLTESLKDAFHSFSENINIEACKLDPSLLAQIKISTLKIPDYSSVVQPAYDAIRTNKDLLTDEQTEALNSISPEILSSKESSPAPRFWTVDRFLAALPILVSILIALIQYYVSTLPNEQLDRIVQNQETMIEQQDSLIRQNERENELLSGVAVQLQQLVDAYNLIYDYIDQFDDAAVCSAQSLDTADDASVELNHGILETDDGINGSPDGPELVIERRGDDAHAHKQDDDAALE